MTDMNVSREALIDTLARTAELYGRLCVLRDVLGDIDDVSSAMGESASDAYCICTKLEDIINGKTGDENDEREENPGITF